MNVKRKTWKERRTWVLDNGTLAFRVMADGGIRIRPA